MVLHCYIQYNPKTSNYLRLHLVFLVCNQTYTVPLCVAILLFSGQNSISKISTHRKKFSIYLIPISYVNSNMLTSFSYFSKKSSASDKAS